MALINWYVDEGLAVLIGDWKGAHPGATVYTIGDSNHSTNPDVTQHAPDRGGSKPGDTEGEIDAGDFMPGKGVTEDNLDDLFDGLVIARDKRLLYAIRRDKIVSSVVRPWEVRDYLGKYHDHCHVSVNDNYANNKSEWHWEKAMGRTIKYVDIPNAKLPELQFGDEDAAHDGWNHVMRVQALLNLQNKTDLDRLDTDGVYGARTVQMVKALYGGTGKALPIEIMKKLYGLN
jgi:hypothetical protein